MARQRFLIPVTADSELTGGREGHVLVNLPDDQLCHLDPGQLIVPTAEDDERSWWDDAGLVV